VETEKREKSTAQNALLRMRLFSANVRHISRLGQFDQLVVQIAAERVIFGLFSRFSQRYPQCFPQILCKERVAFPQDAR
jgi:hypothetical protein